MAKAIKCDRCKKYVDSGLLVLVGARKNVLGMYFFENEKAEQQGVHELCMECVGKVANMVATNG